MTRHRKFAVIAALGFLISACVHNSPSDQIVFQADSEEFVASAAEYQTIWSDDGARIIEVLERRTHLQWKNDPIIAIVLEQPSYSGDRNTPMRLRASYAIDTKRATLVHELCHRLISDIVTRDDDEHALIFLFLYEVWVELWGVAFAESQVAVESRRRGAYDYEGAWKTALEVSAHERAALWNESLEKRQPE